MNCEEVKINLEGYIDGELEGTKAKQAAAHIKQCNSCSNELEYAKLLVEELKSLPELQASPKILTGIKDEIRRREKEDLGVSLLAIFKNISPKLRFAALVYVVLVCGIFFMWLTPHIFYYSRTITPIVFKGLNLIVSQLAIIFVPVKYLLIVWRSMLLQLCFISIICAFILFTGIFEIRKLANPKEVHINGY